MAEVYSGGGANRKVNSRLLCAPVQEFVGTIPCTSITTNIACQRY
jgi:hypothetical protein